MTPSRPSSAGVPLVHGLLARPWQRPLPHDLLALSLLALALAGTGSCCLAAQLVRHGGIAAGHALGAAGLRLSQGRLAARFAFGGDKLGRFGELLLGLVLVASALWLVRIGPEMARALAIRPPVLLALAATANFAWLLWTWPEERRRSVAQVVNVAAQVLLTVAALARDSEIALFGDLTAGLLVALLSLRHGARVVGDAVRDLVDRPVEPETLLPLLEAMEGAGVELETIRRLRSRRAGRRIFIELHLTVPPDETLDQLTARLERVTRALAREPYGVDLAVKVM